MAVDHVIVGLGNPGSRYERTRHNAGFAVLGRLATAHGIELRQQRHRSIVGEGRIGGRRCLLALPQTFMNLSGEAVRRVLDFTGTAVADLVVVADDLDLPFGRLRVRRGGGAGGHRGLASLLEHLGDPDFVRVRVGIGRPPGELPAEAYVLQEFSAAERAELPAVLDAARAAVETVVAEGAEAAMNRFNRAPPPPP